MIWTKKWIVLAKEVDTLVNMLQEVIDILHYFVQVLSFLVCGAYSDSVARIYNLFMRCCYSVVLMH